MDFELNDNQTMLREVPRTLLDTRGTAAVTGVLPESLDLDAKVRSLGDEQGWLGMAVPEEWDGADMGIVELALIGEERDPRAAPGSFTETALGAFPAARGGRTHS